MEYIRVLTKNFKLEVIFLMSKLLGSDYRMKINIEFCFRQPTGIFKDQFCSCDLI